MAKIALFLPLLIIGLSIPPTTGQNKRFEKKIMKALNRLKTELKNEVNELMVKFI